MTYKFPPPPEGRFGKWAYQLWDYVARNRVGAAIALAAGTGLLVGTGTGGTFTAAHATSGVAPGTFGAAGILAQFQVNALGHITNATNAGTLGSFAGLNSLAAAGDVLGTTTTGTLTAALSTTGVTPGTYSQVVVDAKGRITTGGTSTSGPTWQFNQSYLPEGGTLSVGTGLHLIVAGNFAVRGTTSNLVVSGTAGAYDLNGAMFIK